jgi:hypothetical protein
VDAWGLLRLARYRRPEDVGAEIWAAAAAMAERARVLVAPVAVLRGAAVEAVGADGARVEGGALLSGTAVARLLAGCPAAVAFLLTLGPALEEEVNTLADRRDLLEAYLLDLAGWAAIEGALRALRHDLAARARPHGLAVTGRLAPGFADWPLPEQRALLGLLGDDLPARLTEHAVLVPVKSVTGILGLRPALGAPA